MNVQACPSAALTNLAWLDTTGGGGVPANALLNEDGTPILNEDGNYILVE